MTRVVLVLAVLCGRAGAEAYVRVLTQKASVHSGPGNGYREVYVAERNQVFEVVERGTKDFWFKIELDDGKWEVKGRNADGRRIEIDINAATGAIVEQTRSRRR